jgi:trimeric autotransporter adhesin
MAQIIKHRRGSLESLSAVTSSLQKGEIVIASGSSNLSVTNGSSIVFAVPENGQVQAVNRILVGANAPNTFAAGTYNGMLKGVPYYASGSSTLYLLGEGANEIPNLVGNISEYSSSVATNFSASNASITSLSASVASVTGDFSSSVATSFSASTASQTTLSASVATSISASNASVTSLSASVASATGDFSSSVATSFSASNASITSLSASVASVTGDFSSSVATSFSASNANVTSLSSSVATSFSASAHNVSASNAAQDDRLDTIEAVGLTYATTGSNTFNGNQVVSGSMWITGSLVVYGSSSMVNVTASAVNIGDNKITLNTANPAVRFGGISVQDSGSAEGISGSLLWDSQNNNWIYQHPSGGAESGQTAILISGPRNSGSLGDEVHITPGKIMVAVGDDHIGDSIITQATDNSKVNINGGLGVSGSIIVDNTIIGPGSLFLQPDIDDVRQLEIYNTAATDVHIKASGGLTFLGDDTNYVKIDDNAQTVTVVGVNGVFIETGLNVTGSISSSLGFSGSIEGIGNVTAYSQSVSASLAEITANVGSGVGVSITNLNSFTSSIDTTIKDKLDADGVISGSSQVDITSTTGYTTFSGSISSSFSASEASQTTLSASVATSFSASEASQTTLSASVATSFSASSASQTTLSASVATDFSASSASQTTLSASVATDFSASNASITSLSASVASVTGDFSSSVATSFSASAASQTALSSSLASRVTTLEGSGTIQGVGQSNEVTFAKVTTTGDVVVGGDLVVQGNTVTLNTSQLVVEDKVITLASGSTSSATADGAGFEVAGANANFVYQHSTTAFTSSVALIAPAVTSSINLGSTAGNSKRIAFRNTNGNLDLVPTASVAGDLLQWDGTDFVMSNTIDGGSF